MGTSLWGSPSSAFHGLSRIVASRRLQTNTNDDAYPACARSYTLMWSNLCTYIFFNLRSFGAAGYWAAFTWRMCSAVSSLQWLAMSVMTKCTFPTSQCSACRFRISWRSVEYWKAILALSCQYVSKLLSLIVWTSCVFTSGLSITLFLTVCLQRFLRWIFSPPSSTQGMNAAWSRWTTISRMLKPTPIAFLLAVFSVSTRFSDGYSKLHMWWVFTVQMACETLTFYIELRYGTL